ncbi:MAG: molecular chaperone HtpG, partial [Promethearchaeia archaeon]
MTKYDFQAEIKKLLNILSKSLYKHKEIFLRELISNAVDALKKIKFILLTNRDIEDPDEELRIEIFFNPDKKTLLVRDYGVGMAKKELINDLGTIAGSGTEKFINKLKEMQ